MNLLLDTHVLLWALTDDPGLGATGRAAITDARNPVFVSAASVWEIGIKRALGKLRCPDDLIDEVERHRFELLSVTAAHAWAAARLPAIHQDPFDRMLIAQARAESLVLLTADLTVQRYEVSTLRP